MATMCKRCADDYDVMTPPVRTIPAPCDFCGQRNEGPRNYDIPDIQIPNSKYDPNAIAEREESGK